MSTDAITEATSNGERDERDERGRFRPGNGYSWKPGVSGNLLGRRASITDFIRKKVDEVLPGDSRTRAEAIADVLLTLACGGNIQAAKEVLDRVEGRVRQGVDLGLSTDQMSDEEMEEALIAAGIDVHALTLAMNSDEGLMLLDGADDAV